MAAISWIELVWSYTEDSSYSGRPQVVKLVKEHHERSGLESGLGPDSYPLHNFIGTGYNGQLARLECRTNNRKVFQVGRMSYPKCPLMVISAFSLQLLQFHIVALALLPACLVDSSSR